MTESSDSFTTGVGEQPHTAQEVLHLLMRSGRWLVWSCTVLVPADVATPFVWEFHNQFGQVLPRWFDIERQGDENLAVSLNRARLPEDNAECDATSRHAIFSGASGYHQLFRVRLRDGSLSWIEENVTIQALPSGHQHLVGICIDTTDRKMAEERLCRLQEELMAQNRELALREKLQQEKLALAEANVRLKSLATTDGLTGINNHRAFQEQMEKEWHSAARYRRPLSVVLLDIDHFKEFNDTFGHLAGDEVLRRVGSVLRESARQGDCIARYGGEEFVVILPQTDLPGAESIAERFRANIEASSWEMRQITASLGVATALPPLLNAQTLVLEADRALYRAKAGGRNCVRSAPPVDPQSNVAQNK
ncbi:MAG: sensor domain-containing diguanylate cyclase [Capsulimonadaceae bacterium]